MRKITIICEDSLVEEARKNASNIFKMNDGYLKYPLSETGKSPITHWMCYMNVDDDLYNTLKSSVKYSTIEDGDYNEVIRRLYLKKVKTN